MAKNHSIFERQRQATVKRKEKGLFFRQKTNKPTDYQSEATFFGEWNG